MIIVTPSQMADIDRETIQSQGLPGLVLMENAARSCLPFIPEGQAVTVLVGPGNNGGDGLVLARALKEQGRTVNCLLLSSSRSEDAQIQHKLSENWGVTHHDCSDEQKLAVALSGLPPQDILVDALFGTGLSRALEGRWKKIVEWCNSSPDHQFSIDIPSGIDGRNGQILGIAVQAQQTVTFGCLKPAHLLYPGKQFCGQVHLTEPGFHPEALQKYDRVQLFEEEWAKRFLPACWPTMHKGDNGRLLLVTGSSTYPGAGILSVLGAVRGGAGLVTYSCDEQQSQHTLSWCPEAMPVSRPELPDLNQYNAIVVGCGLGRQAASLGLEVMRKAPCPLVIDADCIPYVAELPSTTTHQSVLTPHPGELAKLLGKSVEELEMDRIATARSTARDFGCVVCFKGKPTVTAAPDGRTFVNSTGTPNLAQGGSGDLLAGIIGAYLAYGLPSLEAAACGAYIHGLASQLASEQFGARGVSAHKIAELVPIAYRNAVGKTGTFPVF